LRTTALYREQHAQASRIGSVKLVNLGHLNGKRFINHAAAAIIFSHSAKTLPKGLAGKSFHEVHKNFLDGFSIPQFT